MLAKEAPEAEESELPRDSANDDEQVSVLVPREFPSISSSHDS